MTTSQPKTMHDTRPSSRVRRRLFAEDATEEARKDNTANVLLELIRMDQEKNSEKYNFDFKNEIPLEGAYEWSKVEGYFDWTGKTKVEEVVPEKPRVDIKEENEATPRIKQGEILPIVRKRRTDSDSVDKVVRRKIDFE